MGEEWAFVSGAFQIAPNAFVGSNMTFSGLEGVTITLTDGKRDIRTSVSGEMQEHANDTSIVDCGVSTYTVRIFRERCSLGWSGLGTSVGGVKAKSCDNTLGESSLSEGDLPGLALHIYTKETFGIAFFTDPNLVFLQLGDELINGSIVTCIE